VDNFGQTSGNVWNSWPLFKARAECMYFDAVVFSVCQNDLELFVSNYAPYDQEKRMKTFDEGTVTWAAGWDMLRDIRVWRDTTNVEVLIMFYTYNPGDRPLIDRLQKGCKELGIPFVDVLAFLQDNTAIAVATYAVSEFDGHPSSLAHEMVARRITREIQATGILSKAPTTGKEGAPALICAAKSMIAQGMQPDDAYSWVLGVGDVKSIADRRAHAAGVSGGKIGRWQDAMDWAKASLLDWRAGLRRQVRAKALEATCVEFNDYYGNLAAHRRNFEEMLYFLANAGPQVDYDSAYALMRTGAHHSSAHLDDLRGDIVGAAEEMQRKMALLNSRLGLGKQLQHASENALLIQGVRGLDCNAGLEALLAYEVQMMDRQVHVFERYARAIAPSLKEGSALFKLLSILATSYNSFFIYGDRLSAQAEKVVSMAAPDGPPRTIINVAVDGAVGESVSDRLFDLTVSVIYDVPRRGVIRDRQNAGAIKQRASYYFEFPLLMKGTVVVQVPNRGANYQLFSEGKARFSSIEVGNVDWNLKFPAGGKIVRWTNNGGDRALIKLDEVVLS
jgi:hypothetical protein